MPLTMLRQGEAGVIKRLHGGQDIRRHLEDMGFVAGETVRVVSESGGNIIVELKGSRLALNEDTACHIMVEAARA